MNHARNHIWKSNRTSPIYE